MVARMEADGLHVARGGVGVLKGVSLAVSAGEVVGLIGPNGSGKTTLLGALAGLVPRRSGSVSIDGDPIDRVPREDRARRIGYLEQNPVTNWPIAVEKVVMLGRTPHRAAFRGETANDRVLVERAIGLCGVAGLRGRPVTALSGGERARVMLARVLAGEPRVLLADEPVAGLDPYHRLQVMELLRQLAGEGLAIAVVLHDLSLAARYCDRLCLLEAGTVAACAAPGAVLDSGVAERVFGVRLLRGEGWAIPWQRVKAAG